MDQTFELLDARTASALNKIIQNTRFKKKVSLEEMWLWLWCGCGGGGDCGGCGDCCCGRCGGCVCGCGCDCCGGGCGCKGLPEVYRRAMSSKIYETEILEPETEIMKETPWSRIRGQNSVNK